MTWKEFKDKVESNPEVKDSIEIDYIDVQSDWPFKVMIDKETGELYIN